MKPDGGLSFHILRHCLKKILAEDIDALLAMGFSFEELRLMETLSFKDLDHLSRLGPGFLRITLDPGGLAIALRHIQQETEIEAMQDEMLRRRAPFPMMQALFGMNSQQYANRRKLLGMSGVGVGRPTNPSDDESARVWHAWRQYQALPERQRYLTVSRTTQVTLNTIWTLVNDWKATTGCPVKPVFTPG